VPLFHFTVQGQFCKFRLALGGNGNLEPPKAGMNGRGQENQKPMHVMRCLDVLLAKRNSGISLICSKPQHLTDSDLLYIPTLTTLLRLFPMADASTMETFRNAKSPFDPTSHTPDVILRSSDNVDFYVMKAFLAFSSPDFFAPMFTLPQDQHDIPSPSGLHIVPVAEDSKALRILLLCCYPLDLKDEANDIVNIAKAMSAARKYAMDLAEKRIEKMFLSKALFLLDGNLFGGNPLRIYALACRYGFEELGRAAARKTLEIPPSRFFPSLELNHITGMDMYKLTQSRYRCVLAIWTWYFLSGTKHFFEDQGPYGEPVEGTYVWFDLNSHDDGLPCSLEVTELRRQDHDDWDYYPSGDGFEIFATPWWSTYFVALMKAIELCPSRRTVFKFSDQAYYKALTDASSCAVCRLYAVQHLDSFREYLAKNIDEIVTKVKSQAFRSKKTAHVFLLRC
jgi:hypothetical protein